MNYVRNFLPAALNHHTMKNSLWTSLLRKFLLLVIPLFLLSERSSFAQKLIEVSFQKDMKGNYTFTCVNRAFCTYIVDLSFTKLDNAHCDHTLPYLAVVKPGPNKLFLLTKTDPKEDIVFNYKAGYAKGCLHPSVNPDFTYLYPVTPGKEVQAYEIKNVLRTATNAPGSDSSYAVRLKMKPGDTIYAARRGIVTEVDVSSDANDNGTSGGSDNYVEIVHADCSFGRYGVLRKDGALVHPGQQVEAGQPIGLVGGDRYGRGSDIRFSVVYNVPTESLPGAGDNSGQTHWAYIPLKFWTKFNGKGMLKHGATYTSEFPIAVLTQEKPGTTPKKAKK